MRIRKNLKLCSTSSSSSEDATFHAHICQLNQSPWDLIPFHSHSSFYQFEYDDSSFTPTATAAANTDSIGPVESVASMMDIDNEQSKLEDVAAIAMMELVDDDNAKGSSAKVVTTANNGGGSYNKKLVAVAPAAIASRGSRASANRPRAVGLKKPAAGTSSSTNPYEFYYYSGFGPTWSTKRRGDRSGKEVSKNNGVENLSALQRSDITTTTKTIVHPCDNSNNNSTIIEENEEELEYDLDLVDDDDEEDDYDDDYGKNKRMRKPVKARSLKSLM